MEIEHLTAERDPGGLLDTASVSTAPLFFGGPDQVKSVVIWFNEPEKIQAAALQKIMGGDIGTGF